MTPRAKKKIEEAISQKSKSLNLGMCGLETIPEEVLEMNWLEELILSNRIWDKTKKVWMEDKGGVPNIITSLPNNLYRLINLKALRVGGDLKHQKYSIDNIEILKKLPSLTFLDIRARKIEDLTFLKNLTRLTSLDIRSNKFEDASPLQYLTNLTSLYISDNKQIKNYAFLSNLIKLNTLFISYNYFRNTNYLHGLIELKSLILRDNKFKSTLFLKDLVRLTSLDISNNQLLKIAYIQNLSNLTSLKTCNNNIRDVSFLKNLINLTSLDISENQIKDITNLQTLTELVSLNISNNKISDITALTKLSKIVHLDINSNQIIDISCLKNLIHIKYLDLSNNLISDAIILQNLVSLIYLDLHINNIKNISFLKKLLRLERLDVSKNKIILVSSLNYLTKLIHLNIANNNITDASFLNNLSQINFIDVRDNKLDSFVHFLPLIQKGVPINTKFSKLKKGIYLLNNPWSLPPIEVLQGGNDAVLNYFSNLDKQGKDYLFEAKMIIVGKGGAGKTSLAYKLLNRNAKLPKEEETTRGIKIDRFPFINENAKEFIINIWDFGGQEIYHPTHQFFLTKRSLYILLDDTKDDDKTVNDGSFKYWLQTVELFGNNSPLIIFQNEKGGRSKDLDIKSMQSRFDFIQDSFSDNLISPGHGLDGFEKAVKYYVQNLPHIGQVLPKQWLKIRKELLNISMEYHFISSEKYFEICKEFGIFEKRVMLHLSDYLHTLGTFLHFQKDDLLRKTIILNNEWATEAVYKVLNNEIIKKEGGIITKTDATDIWIESKYANMHPELFSLMLKFEICYLLDDKKETFLVPQLLPQSRPHHFYWETKNNLHLKYKYEFMPKGLLSRYIVRMHSYLKDITKSWKNGVILEKQESYAFIEEIYARNEIVIRISGKNKKQMLTIVSEHLDLLNDKYEGIKVEKLIPCNCSVCNLSEKPHFYIYNNIYERYNNRKYTVECPKKPYENISVVGLLDNFLKDMLDNFPKKEHNNIFEDKKFELITNEVNIYPKVKKLTTLKNVDLVENITIGSKNNNSKISFDSTKSKPHSREKHQKEFSNYNKWWFGRIAGALCGGVLASIISWWFDLCHSFSAFIVGFAILAAFLLYLGNPERRYFRAAFAALGAAISSILLQLGFSFHWTQKIEDGNFKLVLERLTEFEWLISICFLLLSAYLFSLDWKKDKK